MGRGMVDLAVKGKRTCLAAKAANTLSAITYANSKKNLEIRLILGIAFAVKCVYQTVGLPHWRFGKKKVAVVRDYGTRLRLAK